MARRSSGAVVKLEISRIPRRLMCSVRGMGVALSVSTSADNRNANKRCLCSTPNRCSSSTITKPRSANATSLLRMRCVPMTTSTFPAARSANTTLLSAAVLKRDRLSMRNGYARNRSRKVRSCCSASTVVGTNTATCRPLSTALNAARMATSVLPNPTSPQISRSMGRADCISRFTAAIAVSWSSVSVHAKSASNSCIHGVSSGKRMPALASRAA